MLSAVLAVALAAIILLCLVAPPAALAGWPAWNTPTPWKAFANGAPTMWAAGIPQDFTNQLSSALGVVQYGDTYTYYFNEPNLYYQAWQLSTTGAAPVAAGSPGLAVPGEAAQYIGACGTGSDVYVFFVWYGKLGWTQASEDYGVIHTVTAPWVADLTFEAVEGASPVSASFMWGDVVQLDDAFAFVSPNPGDASGQTYDVYLTDLSGSGDITNSNATFTPLADAGASGRLRDLDAIPFSYEGETYLAVASLFGQPQGEEEYWGPAVTPWTGVQAGVYLSSFDAQGFVTPTVQKRFFEPTGPPWMTPPGTYPPRYDYVMSPPDSGPVNIRLARGGVQGGPTGDQLSVLLRTCSGVLDSTISSVSHVNFQPEIFSTYQMAVPAGQQTPSLSTPSQPDWAWQPRTAENDHDDNAFVYQDCTSTGFFVLPVSVQDPGGPATQSTASPGFPYQSWRQYVFFATSADLTLNEQGGSKSSYTGVVGSLGCLTSDKLQPVSQDTVDDAGRQLTTPTDYPLVLTNPSMSQPNADPSQCQLNGVTYGPPPLSLNGWTWESLRPAQSAAASTWVQFGSSSSTNSSSTNENTGGVTAGAQYKGLITKFQASAGWQIDQSTSHSRSSTVSETWQCLPGVTASYDQYGQMFFKQPVFELQRFARLDWQGDAIPDEYLMASNCVDATGVEGAFAFNMTSPGTADPNAPLNNSLGGMTAAPATSDFQAWSQREDPLAMAGSHGSVVELPNGTPVKVSWTGQAAADVQVQKTFASSTGTTKTMSNTASFEAQEKVAWFVSSQNYSHTWSSQTTTNAGESFQCGWQLPVQGVTVPDLSGHAAADAAGLAAAAGLQPSVIYDAAIQGTNGTVFAQSLNPGATVYAGSAIVLSIVGPQPSTPLPMPPAAPIAADVVSMTVEGYWMEANDDQAYWIPSLYRSAVEGQKQLPWCVDWAVLSYQPGSSSAGPGAELACDVRVRARPASAGTVHVLGAESAGGHYARAGAGGVLVAATPADGYRFTGWQLHGSTVAGLRDAGRRTARVVPKKSSGGVTATARFVRIHPTNVELVRRGVDEADVCVVGAPLSRRFAGPVESGDQVTLLLGDAAYVVPPSAWKRAGRGVFVASFRPRAWRQRGDRVRLRLDTAVNVWSVLVRGADQSGGLLRGAATGHLPVALQAGGKALTHSSVPVACRARFTAEAAKKRPAYTVPSPLDVPVDLRRATVRTVVSGDDYRRTRLVVSDVVVRPALLSRSGFDLELNGLKARIGVAAREGTCFVARGRTVEGIGIMCRWTVAGRLSVTIGGGYLERDFDQTVGPNVVLTVGEGAAARAGTMVLKAAYVSSPAVVPRLAAD